ncbi:integrase, partial [Salmonella enterica subsp. enterica serovar Cerro]
LLGHTLHPTTQLYLPERDNQPYAML